VKRVPGPFISGEGLRARTLTPGLVVKWSSRGLFSTAHDPFNGRAAYFFPAAAGADNDQWARTIDLFRAGSERAKQVTARRERAK
jgi:hypothetical protein